MAMIMQQMVANGGRFPGANMLNNSSPAEGNNCYSFHTKDGTQLPTTFPNGCFQAPGVPRTITKAFELCPDEVVCAVTFAPTNDRVYTGGKGCVKLWDISNAETTSQPISLFRCLNDQYVRSCKVCQS